MYMRASKWTDTSYVFFFFKTDENMAELATLKIYITNSMKFSFKNYKKNSILKPLCTPSTTEVRTKFFTTKIRNILHKRYELNWIQIFQNHLLVVQTAEKTRIDFDDLEYAWQAILLAQTMTKSC